MICFCILQLQASRDEDLENTSTAAGSSVSSGDLDDCFDGKETDKDGKKKKNRCALCRKKVGLTGKFYNIY